MSYQKICAKQNLIVSVKFLTKKISLDNNISLEDTGSMEVGVNEKRYVLTL